MCGMPDMPIMHILVLTRVVRPCTSLSPAKFSIDSVTLREPTSCYHVPKNVVMFGTVINLLRDIVSFGTLSHHLCGYA